MHNPNSACGPSSMFDPMDRQDRPTAAACARCRGEIYPGETAYLYEGRWLCPDCFKAEIEKILRQDPRTLALALGLELQRYGETV